MSAEELSRACEGNHRGSRCDLARADGRGDEGPWAESCRTRRWQNPQPGSPAAVGMKETSDVQQCAIDPSTGSFRARRHHGFDLNVRGCDASQTPNSRLNSLALAHAQRHHRRRRSAASGWVSTSFSRRSMAMPVVAHSIAAFEQTESVTEIILVGHIGPAL